MAAVIFLIFTSIEVWATIKMLDVYLGIACSLEYGLLIAAVALITNGVALWIYFVLRKHSVKSGE